MQKRLLVICCLAVLTQSCSEPPSATEVIAPVAAPEMSQQMLLDKFFASFTDRWVEVNPDQAIATGYFSGDKQNDLAQQLTPRTREYALQRIALARAGLTELGQFDLTQATQLQRRAAQLMQWQLSTTVSFEPYLDFIDFPLQQMDGANVDLIDALTIVQPLQTVQDAQNYVARLQQVDDRMREAIADAQQRVEQGSVVPPVFIIQSTIAQIQNFLQSAPEANPLVTTLADKSAEIGEFDGDYRASLVQQAQQIVQNEIYPAWQDALVELTRQQGLAGQRPGLSRFKDGAQIYQQLLRAYTSTDYTPEQIHQMGLQEVARIEAEMDALFKQLGLTEGSILERTEQLTARTAYSNDDAGRAQMTQDIQAYVADAQIRSAALFDQMPKAPVVAQPYPAFQWETAAAGYTVPPQDGSRPAIFQFPLRQNELMSYDKRSLVYHETVPGHHFQLALLNENKALPRFMQVRAFGGISAITEGWALYAERLAAESGWYEGDIEGQLGYLDSMLFRARRLVVDTGLHTKGWTRQQAIDYGIAPSEVDRYVVWPGQACSYMVGQLKIVELREKARTALGERFALQEFHNVVLGAGVVPLTMLEALVDEYIASK